MSEAMIGYLEAIFMTLGILLIGGLVWRTYHPARRDELEAHGRRLLERDDIEGGPDGSA
jgi:cbb3-type cytochrome oxidase subunit 3